MGRSVSIASGSVHVEYATFEAEDEFCASEDFMMYADDFASQLCRAFPSVTTCNTWLDREDRAIAENHFAYFGVSEYCGLVSMWCTPKDNDYDTSTGLRDRWINSIGAKFTKIARNSFGQSLVCTGRFSNGEAMFTPINGNQRGEMGIGYSSKCGWL